MEMVIELQVLKWGRMREKFSTETIWLCKYGHEQFETMYSDNSVVGDHKKEICTRHKSFANFKVLFISLRKVKNRAKIASRPRNSFELFNCFKLLKKHKQLKN